MKIFIFHSTTHKNPKSEVVCTGQAGRWGAVLSDYSVRPLLFSFNFYCIPWSFSSEASFHHDSNMAAVRQCKEGERVGGDRRMDTDSIIEEEFGPHSLGPHS